MIFIGEIWKFGSAEFKIQVRCAENSVCFKVGYTSPADITIDLPYCVIFFI